MAHHLRLGFFILLTAMLSGCYEPKLDQPPPPAGKGEGKGVRKPGKADLLSGSGLTNISWKDAIYPYNVQVKEGKVHLNPQKTALVVVALQQFFTDAPSNHMAVKIIPVVNKMIRAARTAGMPVIFLQQGARTDAEKQNELKRWWGKALAPGEVGYDLDPSLSRLPGDPVVVFPHYSGFVDTDLRKMLQDSGTEDLVIMGAVTNIQVESTARDAFTFGYRVFIPVDTTVAPERSLIFSSLRNMAFGFAYIFESEALIKEIEKAVQANDGKPLRSPSP